MPLVGPQGVNGGLRMTPIGSCILRPGETCLGKIRSGDLTGGVSLEVGFKVSEAHVIISFSMPCGYGLST